MNELNSPTNLPLRYRAFCVLYCNNIQLVENAIHSMFDAIDPTLHAREQLENGKERIREFFLIDKDKAFVVLQQVARLIGESKCLLKKIDVNEEDEELENIIEDTHKEQEKFRKKLRSAFTFTKVDILPGAELVFIKDETKICKVINSKEVEYNGNIYSLSALAGILLDNPEGSYQGPAYFKYNGEILSNLRNRIEQMNNE